MSYNDEIRKKSVEEYYKNPNICLYCKNIIHLENKKPSEIRKKKFCNSSCFALYLNYHNPNSKKQNAKKYFCVTCGDQIILGRKYCNDCFKTYKHLQRESKYNENSTIKDLRELYQHAKSSYTIPKTIIDRHANVVYDQSGQKRVCAVCGYTLHCEICHKTPSSKFPDDATLKEINDINNLVALCCNHHWEFDNGYITLN